MPGSEHVGSAPTMKERVTPEEFLNEWLPELLQNALDALQYLAPFDQCILGNTITLVDMGGSDAYALGGNSLPIIDYPATFHWHLTIVASDLSGVGLQSDSRALTATFTIESKETTITYTLNDRDKQLRRHIDPLPVQDGLIDPEEQITAVTDQEIVTSDIVEKIQESLSSWPHYSIEESVCNQAYRAIHAHIEAIPPTKYKKTLPGMEKKVDWVWQGWRLTGAAELWLRQKTSLEDALEYAIEALERTKGFCDSPTIQQDREELEKRLEEVRKMYTRTTSIGMMSG